MLKIPFVYRFLINLLVVKRFTDDSFKFRTILTCLKFNDIILGNLILIEWIVCNDFLNTTVFNIPIVLRDAHMTIVV
ncbi:hypothetical protein HMPREF9425_1673 [Streptococcus vestibularis ATCC 49124]|uniref:Uncharacterized protein n=1 Tax=Streptococcus vestibularis ATCC 49124 TaxID=889206 RepID=A0ABP2KGM9_STRVE|nr:hypothetical protein HMPREF9425_1673 [Streptococcus vestibularis ATCC 49124]